MASRSLPNQYAMNSGELSPLLANRMDQARYAYGARRMRNFLPTLQGPARKRPRFSFLAETCISSSRPWIIPFVKSQTDSFLIEFSNSKCRFYTDNGQVLESAKTITGITQASPGVITSASHGLSNGDEVVIASVGGMTQLNGRNFIVANATANTFSLVDLWGVAVNTTGYGAYTSGGTASRVYTLASPYPASALTDTDGTCLISYAQSQDTVYLCVPGYAPRKLTRSGPASWAFATLDQTGGPFETVDPDQTITVYASGATGSITLTASSGIFNANHVGALFLLERKLTDTVTAWESGKSITSGNERRSQGNYYEALNSATTGTITPSHTEGARYDGDTGVQWQYKHSGYGWAKITSFISSTSVNATVLSTIPSAAVGSGNASTQWAFGSWSADLGYPTHVCFFRERLCFFSGTKLWASVPADYENFSERDAGQITDDSAFSLDFRSGQNDEIRWAIPASDLLIGTSGGEKTIGEISTSDPFGPANAAVLEGPGYSSRQVAPIRVNDDIFYATSSGRMIRSLRFAFETDGYVSLNMVAFADHIAKGQVIQMAYCQEPQSVIWAACNDGSLVSLSYEREHELRAFALHSIGGSGVVESVARLPSPDGTRDTLYAVIKRTINGQTKRYIEFLEADWDPESDDVEDQKYADSGLTYDGTATTTITGLHHLEGATVKVLADGRYVGEKTVSSGGFSLDVAAAKVQAGLSYTATLQSMSLTNPGVIARIVKFFARLYATIGLKAGPSESSLETVMETNTTLSGASAPFTGTKRVERGGKHSREEEGDGQFMTIVHDAPTHCTVTGLIADQVATTER